MSLLIFPAGIICRSGWITLCGGNDYTEFAQSLPTLIKLIANRSGYRRYTGLSGIFCSLKTEFHCLSRLNCSVPTHGTCTVRIAAADRCVPAVGHARTIRVIPAHIPPVDRVITVIGNANRAGKTVAPLVGHHIGATAITTG